MVLEGDRAGEGVTELGVPSTAPLPTVLSRDRAAHSLAGHT